MTSPDVILNLAESLHPLERKVLAIFQNGVSISEQAILNVDPSLQASQLSMALGWLQTKEILVLSEETKEAWVSLTPLGRTYAEKKNPFLQIADEVAQRGETPLQNLGGMLEAEERSAAIGALKKCGALSLGAGGIVKQIDSSKLTEFIVLQKTIEFLEKENTEIKVETLPLEYKEVVLSYHHKRGKSKGIFRIDERVLRSYIPTERFAPVYEKMLEGGAEEEIGALTPQMLKDGSWRGKKFRKYNISLPPPRICFGRRHPYQTFLSDVREKLCSMGFTELDGPIIESEFWNMDALYMPQFHPAREIHDVYFVKGPKGPIYDETISQEQINRVASTHERGGETGSTGWGYKFDSERTRRLILRSQGTAVSSRMLASQPAIPGKYFSIARCFRYDQVDATHAPDFFQVEGIVLGEEINFRTLLGLLTLFAKEIALAKEVKFLPAYFPFTEPSVEMHVVHPKVGLMELGGAGIFRPEVTKPLGVNVPVIAWGLGLDRLAMMALKISDIRDLFSSDLSFIRR